MRYINANLTLTAFAAISFASLASNAKARVSTICPEFDRNAKELSVKVSTGCITGMARFKEHDLQLNVDQHTAHISVIGGIEFHPIKSQAITADCMGRQSFILTASDIEPRRYSLSYEGRSFGIVNLLDGLEQPDCKSVGRKRIDAAPLILRREAYRDWSSDFNEDWRSWRAESVAGLIDPILSQHPEGLEGKPEVTVRIEKRRWGPSRLKGPLSSGAPIIAVWITRHGFGDDSVSGDRFVIAASKNETGWQIQRLWHQQMCARGDYAGQWTAVRCP